MIKSIRLGNFQSHKDTELEFHEGVNVIVGPSDSGKTAILRAMSWVLWNRPSGDAFRSHWGGDTFAQIGVEKQQRISRERGKDGNKYTATSGDGSPSTCEFKAVGRDVPEEISRLLNMDSINVQSQMDAPFLLSESPAEVARTLNRVASLDDIDKAHSGIASLQGRTWNDLKRNKDGVDTLKEALASYAFLPEMEERIVRLEKAEKRIDTLRRSITSLQGNIDDLVRLAPLLKRANRVAGLLGRAESLAEKGQAIKQTEGVMAGLSNNIAKLRKYTTERDELESQIDTLEKAFHKTMPDICPLCGRGQPRKGDEK